MVKRWYGGHADPIDIARITARANELRMTPIKYMVAAALALIEHPTIVNKAEPKSSDGNRRTSITKKIEQYMTLEVTRNELYGEIYLLRTRIKELQERTSTPDVFSATVDNPELDELLYELEAAERDYRDPKLGEGILRDISNYLSDSRTLDMAVAGTEATHMVIASPVGTVTVPLKVREDKIWIGGLPKNSVIYINGTKIV